MSSSSSRFERFERDWIVWAILELDSKVVVILADESWWIIASTFFAPISLCFLSSSLNSISSSSVKLLLDILVLQKACYCLFGCLSFVILWVILPQCFLNWIFPKCRIAVSLTWYFSPPQKEMLFLEFSLSFSFVLSLGAFRSEWVS